MSELTDKFRMEFRDEETRHIYADDFLNTYIASQLKVLREDHGWTQQRLAERAGMRQERISVLEDVNYESWSVRTLKRLAKAFDLRLSIKFESFGSFLREFDEFSRDALTRPSFADDPAFAAPVAMAAAVGENLAAQLNGSPQRENVVWMEEFVSKRQQSQPEPRRPLPKGNPLGEGAVATAR